MDEMGMDGRGEIGALGQPRSSTHFLGSLRPVILVGLCTLSTLGRRAGGVQLKMQGIGDREI